jgi:5-methylthioribose kinase
MTDGPEAEIRETLTTMGLGGTTDAIRVLELSGGVSCDVYRVDIGSRTLCLKRALPKLRVEADWHAPLQRSSTEVAWLKLARTIVPDAVPAILGEDKARHIFAMEYLPPEKFPVWKGELAAGRIDAEFARDVGRTLARIHAATAGRVDIAMAFANDEQFLALRMEPFFLYAASKHPEIAAEIRTLSDGVAAARIALMQGDISPKNILCGPNGPVFLDAETACYGDPAFDLAFCLNHLLLKCVWHPEWREGYLASFAALAAEYHEGVTWEEPVAVESRAAHLLPALLLARVDGRSPAEYLDNDCKKGFVRAVAIALLREKIPTLDAIAQRWAHAIAVEFLQPEISRR